MDKKLGKAVESKSVGLKVEDYIAVLTAKPHSSESRPTDHDHHRRWYNSLSEDDQAKVRDAIREEIRRIRNELGRGSEASYPMPAKRRKIG
ncbi:hypothetical protein ACIPL1_18590 [Pseudomonas sp. NPDC090202]|uniref:hypothetical protein n=1 Tax=unclassified Pseudomonas TaxID=196821 RepID=UPI00381EF544